MPDKNSIGSKPTGSPEDKLSRFLPEGRSLGDLPTDFVEAQQSITFASKHVIADRFEVIEELGFGGMGAVYKVKDNLMHGKEKALKIILPALVRSEVARKRFIAEAEIAQSLRHDGIVTVYDIGEDKEKENLFLTMELLEGQNLAKYLKSQGGKLEFNHACDIAHQMCDALKYAHNKKVIHIDTGAGNYGSLTAIELPSLKIWQQN